MSENGNINPDERFTFVDKRRTAEPADVYEPEEEVSEEQATEALANESADGAELPTYSIYEIGAYCAGMLINEGFTRLGLIADPQTGKAVQDLPSARVAIDCVAALVTVLDEESSTLPATTRRELKRTLNDLRLNYIQRKAE